MSTTSATAAYLSTYQQAREAITKYCVTNDTDRGIERVGRQVAEKYMSEDPIYKTSRYIAYEIEGHEDAYYSARDRQDTYRPPPEDDWEALAGYMTGWNDKPYIGLYDL